MIKNNPKIKENISMLDQINAIKSIVSSCFTELNGTIEYTPYYQRTAEFNAIAMNFLEGITFEDKDSVFAVENDKEIFDLVKKFYYNIEEQAENENEENYEYINIMNFVESNVTKIVEFEKNKIIHRNEKLEDKIALGIESVEKISYFFEVIADALYNFSKLDLKTLKPENIELIKDVLLKLKDSDMTEESISNIIKNAVGFNMNKATQDIINDKNKQIVELQKYKKLYEARNVVTDK
ncbi:MAG: hypothetical protein ACLRPZ_04165 [Coprococcus sp.]